LVDVELNGQRTYHGPVHVDVTNNHGLNHLSSDIPDVLMLYPNFPNPFNPSTMINYQLPMVSDVELSVYNLLGQKIKTLVSERQEAGTYQVKWDGRSDMGKSVSNGIYYAVLSNQDLVKTINMILIK